MGFKTYGERVEYNKQWRAKNRKKTRQYTYNYWRRRIIRELEAEGMAVVDASQNEKIAE